jgi:hypothetical protein
MKPSLDATCPSRLSVNRSNNRSGLRGRYQFSNDALWGNVRAGTLIVLRNNNSAADISVGGSDYNLDLGLQNPTYFGGLAGSFDIATTEMVMIKSAGSGAAGVNGSVHALAGGSAGTQFTSAPTPKLLCRGGAGPASTNCFVTLRIGPETGRC